MPTDTPTPVLGLNYRPQRSFTVRAVENGFIVETHGEIYRTFVFRTQEEVFDFLTKNF